MNSDLHLLIVDDEPNMLATLQDILEEFGWHVNCATSGNEALDLLANLDVDFVLMDFNMPGLSGVETAEKMILERPHLPVFLMSADVSELWKAKAVQCGVRAVLSKPLDIPSAMALLTEHHKQGISI